MNKNENNKFPCIESTSFYQVYGWMLKLGLEKSEITILAIIYGFSKDGKSSYNGSLSYLAQWSQLTKSFVIKVIARLINKNLIIKIEEYSRSIKKCYYRVNLEYINKHFGDEVVYSVHQCNQYTTSVISTPGGVISAPNNIEYNIEDKLINRYTDKPLNENTKSSLHIKIDEIKKYCSDNGLDYSFYKSLNYKISRYYYSKKFDIEECKIINDLYNILKLQFDMSQDDYDKIMKYTIDKAYENKKTIINLEAYINTAFRKNLKQKNMIMENHRGNYGN